MRYARRAALAAGTLIATAGLLVAAGPSAPAGAAAAAGAARSSGPAGTAPRGRSVSAEIQVNQVGYSPGRKTEPARIPRPDRASPPRTGHDRTSIACFQRADHPGSLYAILGQFSARNINLKKLESRPTKKALGDYCFVIDLEGHVADES